MKPKVFFVVTLFWVLFIATTSSCQQEEITLSTYYPAPFGEYDELCAEKLLVSLPSAAELQDMARGDCHITRSLIVGTAGGGFSYDALNTAGTPLYDGDVIIEGSVGIGTTEPAYKLDINTPGGITDPGLRVYSGTYGLYGSVADTDNANGGRMEFHFGATENSPWVGGAGYVRGFTIRDITAGQTRFFIDPTGNVGIGTTGPNVKLDVRGAASSRVQMTLSDGNTASAMIRAGNSTAAVFGSDVGINFRTGASWTDADSGGTTVM